MKGYKQQHFQSKDGKQDIFISWYTTKSGFLRFHIEIYAAEVWNDNGFADCIANYNTSDNALLTHLRHNDYFMEV